MAIRLPLFIKGIFLNRKRLSSNALAKDREILLDLKRRIYLLLYQLLLINLGGNKLAKESKSSKKKGALSWVITAFVLTFVLSLVFSFISNFAINGLDIFPALLVLILVILIGIIFDLIGVATTVAKEEEFHSMASKKIHGSKEAIKLIRNSPKVSNFCADVIGDICRSIKWIFECFNYIKINRKIWSRS